MITKSVELDIGGAAQTIGGVAFTNLDQPLNGVGVRGRILTGKIRLLTGDFTTGTLKLMLRESGAAVTERVMWKTCAPNGSVFPADGGEHWVYDANLGDETPFLAYSPSDGVAAWTARVFLDVEVWE